MPGNGWGTSSCSTPHTVSASLARIALTTRSALSSADEKCFVTSRSVLSARSSLIRLTRICRQSLRAGLDIVVVRKGPNPVIRTRAEPTESVHHPLLVLWEYLQFCFKESTNYTGQQDMDDLVEKEYPRYKSLWYERSAQRTVPCLARGPCLVSV